MRKRTIELDLVGRRIALFAINTVIPWDGQQPNAAMMIPYRIQSIMELLVAEDVDEHFIGIAAMDDYLQEKVAWESSSPDTRGDPPSRPELSDLAAARDRRGPRTPFELYLGQYRFVREHLKEVNLAALGLFPSEIISTRVSFDIMVPSDEDIWGSLEETEAEPSPEPTAPTEPSPAPAPVENL